MDFIVYFYTKKMMLVSKDISLKTYNTFGLDYKADCLIHLKTEEEAISLFSDQNDFPRPFLIIGGGSNILFTKDFRGTIIHPEFDGINVEEQDHENILISAGAGVIWDKFVGWTVDKGLGGLENLSLIPGTIGATPVQNIGAYGVEVKDSIEKVSAISFENGSIIEFSKIDCHFEYRDSTFKNKDKGRYLITKVYYRLNTNPLPKLDYGSLNSEIENLGEATLKNIRQAVINIRRSKLPDPEITGNAGSFFKNPVVSSFVSENLKKKFPEMPVYDAHPGYRKLAAAWLIEKCGWKGKKRGDAGVHDKQALVIVNYGKATGEEIFELSELIKKSVIEMFGVDIEREVEVF